MHSLELLWIGYLPGMFWEKLGPISPPHCRNTLNFPILKYDELGFLLGEFGITLEAETKSRYDANNQNHPV